MNKVAQSPRRKLKKLIESVWRANLQLYAAGLAPLTWGNVSQIDRAAGLIAIKPSGVAYEKMKPEDIVLTDIRGEKIASALRPSSDLPSHLALYRSFPAIGAIAHTHSRYATAFAQAGRPVECLGTTQADYALGAIPVTDPMKPAAIRTDYEFHTGEMIVKKIRQLKINPRQCPFMLVAQHAPFTWGANAAEAVENAIVLEYLCQTALLTCLLDKNIKSIPPVLMDKHYFRKHGRQAYYGQEKGGADGKIFNRP